MTRYVALLRGINVGGRRKVPMAQLRDLAVTLGLADVATYIASGNLLFSSPKDPVELSEVLGAAIEQRFGFAVPVVVVSASQLAQAVEGNPYPAGDPKQVNVTFVSHPLTDQARERISSLAAGDERVDFARATSTTEGASWFYVDFAGGLARSKLAAKVHELPSSGVATTRNIRTVQTLRDLSADGSL